MVSLSRSNRLNAAREEGAGNDFEGSGLVASPDHRFWRLYTFYSQDHMACYQLLGMVNQQVRYPAKRWCYFRRCLPIMVNPRWSERSGERLDFYIQETLPREKQS
jgi:hypothetical protein